MCSTSFLLWWRYFMWTPSNPDPEITQCEKCSKCNSVPSPLLYPHSWGFILGDSDFSGFNYLNPQEKKKEMLWTGSFLRQKSTLAFEFPWKGVLIRQWSLAITFTILWSTYWWPQNLSWYSLQVSWVVTYAAIDRLSDVLHLTVLQTLSLQSSQSQWLSKKRTLSCDLVWKLGV